MPRLLKIKFSKSFFASLLHLKESSLSYAFLVFKEGEEITYRPAIAVHCIKRYAFDITYGVFIRVDNDAVRVEKARIRKIKHEVVFSNGNAEEHVRLVDFYRFYGNRIANDMLS